MSSAAYLPPRPAPIPGRSSHRLLLAVFGAVLVDPQGSDGDQPVEAQPRRQQEDVVLAGP